MVEIKGKENTGKRNETVIDLHREMMKEVYTASVNENKLDNYKQQGF